MFFVVLFINYHLALAGSTTSHSANLIPDLNHVNYSIGDGDSIVMEDDVMLVDSSPNESVLKIEVFYADGSLYQTLNGCLTSHCRVDASALECGNYIVRVTTVNGKKFSDSIIIE